jgi:hypothetical protein
MKLPVKYDKCNLQQRQFVKEAYIKKQNGLCCHCGNSLDRPPHESVRNLPVDITLFPLDFFKHPTHLHHDHTTGLTIGAVHNHCNAVLWQHFGE